jgi:hypothetical protein
MGRDPGGRFGEPACALTIVVHANDQPATNTLINQRMERSSNMVPLQRRTEW